MVIALKILVMWYVLYEILILALLIMLWLPTYLLSDVFAV